MNEHQHPDDPQLLALNRIEQLLCQLRDGQREANTPARLRTMTLTPERLIERDEVGPAARSIGIINPTSVKIYIGFAGSHAAPGNHAFVVPPESGMVIPVAVDKVEIGADPTDLGTDTATIFVLRFNTVQQFLFWNS